MTALAVSCAEPGRSQVDFRRLLRLQLPRRRLDHEAMLGIEHHLVAGQQHRVAHRASVDRAAFAGIEVAQQHAPGVVLEARVALGWSAGKDLQGQPLSWHNGSDDVSYSALMAVSSVKGVATAALVNGLAPQTEAAISRAVVQMIP